MFSYRFQRFQRQLSFAGDVVVEYALWDTIAHPGHVLARDVTSHRRRRLKQRLEGLIEERGVVLSGGVDKQRVRL